MYRNVRLSIDSFENDFEKENDVAIVKWRAVFIKYLETACINLVINIFDLYSDMNLICFIHLQTVRGCGIRNVTV